MGPTCGESWRKEKVTDRALRYRSTSKECRPAEPPICAFCGNDQRIMVGHVNGYEEDINAQNLIWTCRSCNAKVAHVMKSLGMGRRTKQFNPRGQGAKTLGQWMAAVMGMKGESYQMSVSDAVEMIHATPPEARSEFAREIWHLRRKHGTAGRGSRSYSDEVPF